MSDSGSRENLASGFVLEEMPKGVYRVELANGDSALAHASGPKKRVEVGLTYIYGIGRTRSKSLLFRAGINFDKKVGDLTEEEVNHVRQILEEEGAVEGDLRKEVSMNIKRHIEMGSYRGLRHRRGLPVRGQRTHTNARTRKGPRRGTVANKKKATGKT